VVTLLECVPNFSEGRRPDVVAEIVAAIAAVLGVSRASVYRHLAPPASPSGAGDAEAA